MAAAAAAGAAGIPSSVPVVELGRSGLRVSALGLGCMGMSEWYGPSDDAESTGTIRRAVELGVTLIDSADAYGRGHNERLLGAALAGGLRERVIVATKFGNLRDEETGKFAGFDGTAAYVRKACDASLQRLGLDHIDLYYQHRVDPRTPIEETVGALAGLVAAGKVRHLGLSEARPEDIRRAQAVHPIAALQSEYSLFEREVESDVLPLCRELGIGFVPFSPLGRGVLTGRFKSNADYDPSDDRGHGRYPRAGGEALEANARKAEIVAEVAARHPGATAAQVALAWLVAQGTVPIPGTRNRARLEENVASLALALTSADMSRLDDVGQAAGDRYPGGRNPDWVSPPLPA